MQKQKQCQHNHLLSIDYSEDINQGQIEYCEICAHIIDSEQQENEQEFEEEEQAYDQEKIFNESNNTIKVLFKFSQEILKCNQFSIQDLNDILLLTQENIKEIKQMLDQFICLEQKCFEGGYFLLKYLKRKNQEIISELNKWLAEKQQSKNNDHLFQMLNEKYDKNNEGERQNLREWQTKQLIMSTFKNKSPLDSFEFNNNNTLLFTLSFGEIQLKGFNSHNKLIKTLRSDYYTFSYLKCLKKLDVLLSITQDQQIIIWNNQWFPKQILQNENIIALPSMIRTVFLQVLEQKYNFGRDILLIGTFISLSIHQQM